MGTLARTAAASLAVAVLVTLPLGGTATADETTAPSADCAASAAAVETARAAVLDLRQKFTLTKLHPAKVAKKLAADPSLRDGVDRPDESATAPRGKPTAEQRAERKQAQRDKVAGRKAALTEAKAFKKAVKAEWEAAKAELRAARHAHEECVTAQPTDPEDPAESPEGSEPETDSNA